MRLSIKEKAGISDTSRIFEGLHLTDEYIRNSAVDPESIEPEFKKEGERHFNACNDCRNKKESFLPLSE